MRLAQIAQAPATYPEVSQIRVGYRRSVYGVHSVYYRELDSNTVEITRVIGREAFKSLEKNTAYRLHVPVKRFFGQKLALPSPTIFLFET